MKKIISKHSVLLLITTATWLFTTQVFARSSYNLKTHVLYMPTVSVDGVYQEVYLTFDGDKTFTLMDSKLANQTSDQLVIYDSTTGIATIPYVEIAGVDKAYSASLTLVSVNPVVTLKLTSLEEITVLQPPEPERCSNEFFACEVLGNSHQACKQVISAAEEKPCNSEFKLTHLVYEKAITGLSNTSIPAPMEVHWESTEEFWEQNGKIDLYILPEYLCTDQSNCQTMFLFYELHQFFPSFSISENKPNPQSTSFYYAVCGNYKADSASIKGELVIVNTDDNRILGRKMINASCTITD